MNRKIVTGTNPAANTEFSEAVPTGKRWQLVSVTVSLVQGATQTPRPILVIDDGGGTPKVIFESFGASGAQSASTTAFYVWAPGLDLSALVGSTPDIHATAPLPDKLVLHEGYRVRSVTLGKGANTDYAAPVLYVIEF